MIKHAIQCKSVPEDKKDKLRQIYFETSENATPTTTGLLLPVISEEVNNCLVKAVSFPGLPFRLFDQSDFRRAFELLNHKKLPHSDKVSEYLLPRLSNRSRHVMLDDLKSADDYSITIEFDGWQDLNRHHIKGITAIKSENKVHLLKLIDDSRLSPTVTRICDIVSSTIESFMEPSKMNAVVSDEAGNCRVARSLIVEKEGFRGIFQFRCFAHVLNLVGKQAATNEQLKGILANADSIVRFVNHRQTLRATLEAQEGYTKLVQDVSTRWYTTRKKVTSLLKNKYYIDGVVHELGGAIFENLESVVKDHAFWADLQEVADVYETLCEIIAYSVAFDSSLAVAFEKFIHFGLTLYNQRNKKFRLAMFDALLLHSSRLDHGFLFTCLACSPKCEAKLLTAETLSMFKQKLLAIPRTMTDDRKAIFATIDEFKVYMNTRNKSYDLPREVSSKSLYKGLAKRLSRLHPSSTNTERLFSSLMHIQTDKKSRMTLDTLEDIIRVRMDDLNLKRKPKTI